MMQSEISTIDKLLAFKQRDKFSVTAWKERGLNPSDDALCGKLTILFNSVADTLIASVRSGHSTGQLKRVLKAELSKFHKPDYDTEEKEFICDLFNELATILKVDFRDNLNRWLYGLLLMVLVKIGRLIHPERVVETLKQPCTNCSVQLESYVMKRGKDILEDGWYLVKCNHCKEFNLLSPGSGISQLKFGNYQYIETFSSSEYTYEQALIRMEQIRYFRK